MTPIYIMIDQQKTGRNILQMMRRSGLKVRDLQEACGFEQPQAVYKWIHGQSLPSIDNLLILSKLFDSTVEGILAVSGNALPLSGASGPACGLQPFFLFEVQQRHKDNQYRYDNDRRIGIWRIQLRHILKIHSIPAGNQGERH